MLQKIVDSRILMKFFKNFDQNTGGKLVASTLDDFIILQEFWWEMQQMTVEFIWNFD